MHRVNVGKWWMLRHSDGRTARFNVDTCPHLEKDRTPENVTMTMEMRRGASYGTPEEAKTADLTTMRLVWKELCRQGFKYGSNDDLC